MPDSVRRWLPKAASGPLAIVLFVAVMSRLVVAIAMLTATPPQAGAYALDASWPFVTWDGPWYLSIVKNGYHAYALDSGHPDFAFFPLWPVAIIAGSLFGLLDPGFVAPLLSTALFLLAIIVVFRLLERRFGPSTAQRATILLALAPGATAFTLAYSESLYVLLAAAALFVGVATRRGIVLVILASLTRLVGPALSLAALPDVRSRPRLALIALAAGPVTFLVWCGFIWHLTGDPLGYMRGSPAWWAGSEFLSGPMSAFQAVFVTTNGLALLVAWVAMFLALISIAGGLMLLRRAPDLGLYVLGVLAPTILVGNWPTWPRLLLAAFPALVVLTRSRGVFLTSALAFGVLQVLFARGQASITLVP